MLIMVKNIIIVIKIIIKGYLIRTGKQSNIQKNNLLTFRNRKYNPFFDKNALQQFFISISCPSTLEIKTEPLFK